MLGYAFTLPDVMIHCSPELVPGQTYVALSRATQESTLQVLGFQHRFILSPPNKLNSLITHESKMTETDHTCKNVVIEDTIFKSGTEESGVSQCQEDNALAWVTQ